MIILMSSTCQYVGFYKKTYTFQSTEMSYGKYKYFFSRERERDYNHYNHVRKIVRKLHVCLRGYFFLEITQDLKRPHFFLDQFILHNATKEQT